MTTDFNLTVNLTGSYLIWVMSVHLKWSFLNVAKVYAHAIELLTTLFSQFYKLIIAYH